MSWKDEAKFLGYHEAGKDRWTRAGSKANIKWITDEQMIAIVDASNERMTKIEHGTTCLKMFQLLERIIEDNRTYYGDADSATHEARILVDKINNK